MKGLRVPPPVPSRVAREASAAWNVTKTLVQMVVFWSVLLFAVPPLIAQVERTHGWRIEAMCVAWMQVVGVVMFVLGGTLGLSSAWVMATAGAGTPLPFDCPRRLVLGGAYRYVRNPMAIAGLAQGAATGLFLGSWGVLVYTACGFLVWNYLVRVWEEDDLHARFGAEYDAYRAAVRCWWPRRTAYRGT